MKTIKSLKDISALEVGDVVMFGDLEYKVHHENGYFLSRLDGRNDKIFTNLNISKKDFVKNLGINTLPINWDFPEVCSLEALTAIVFALFKEYEKQNEFPKTWKEFCEKYPIQKGECYIRPFCQIHEAEKGLRNANEDRNYFTSKQEAEAFLALMQLRQLRKCYIGNWEPNWTDEFSTKYCIEMCNNEFLIHSWYRKSHNLSFPNHRLAEQFLNNFKDLLEIAKPLL